MLRCNTRQKQLAAGLGTELRAEREIRDGIVWTEAWLRGLPPAFPARPMPKAA